LIVPNGVVVDSKGQVYIADSKVRAIFIVKPETGEYSMIRNGYEARFQWLTGLAIDDSDQLFASDTGMHRVLVFDTQQKKVTGTISEGLFDPGGMAVDNENRLLYVTDAEQDMVLVYDADTHKLLRKIGKPNTKHTSTVPGEFAKPTNCAVDADGNLYVSDTANNRIEVFDADGNFIRTFGKAGDGPGYFARPKGIAIDSDGHVWVADAMQDRLQAFTPEGRLLIYLGGHGLLPGRFRSLAGVTFDKKSNRIMTTEQLPGRMQMFRYFTDSEARAELKRREEEGKKKRDEKASATATAEPAAKTDAPAAK
jgi:DNA-binding beta-propeller fold protein YncE